MWYVRDMLRLLLLILVACGARDAPREPTPRVFEATRVVADGEVGPSDRLQDPPAGDLRPSLSSPSTIDAGTNVSSDMEVVRASAARDPTPLRVIDAATIVASDAEGLSLDAAVDVATPKDAPPPATPSRPHEMHRIISVHYAGSDVLIVVRGGAREGISEKWNATLVDASGRPADAEIRIVSVEKDYTNLRAHLHITLDQLKDKLVRLSPLFE